MIKKCLLIVVITTIVLWIFLLISDNRILVSETKVEPGQSYILSDWGNVGEAEQASLVCRYFTGRSITVKVYWYSANNFLGKDQCPFIIRD